MRYSNHLVRPTLNTIKSKTKHWVEALLIMATLVTGIKMVDQYNESRFHEAQFQTATLLLRNVSELIIAAFLVGSRDTEHYDRQAQLMLLSENVFNRMQTDEKLDSSWSEFKQTVNHFVQLSSMLKTSYRFAASAESLFVSANPQLARHGEHLLAALVEFQMLGTDKVRQDILDYMDEHNVILSQLDALGMQWSMLNRHINFILRTSNKVNALTNEIQRQAISQQLYDVIEEHNNALMLANRQFDFYAVLLVSELFLLFITLLLRQREELIVKSKQAQAAAQAKSMFLSNMSHEIRTPLNGIIGLADLCLRTDLTKNQRDYLEKLLFSGQSLLTIINDILDFSKMESNKLDIVSGDFEVEKLFSHVKGIMAKSASDKGLELVFDVKPDVPQVLHGDSIRIGQILLNLTSNACKFTESGHIIVSLQRKNDKIRGRNLYRFSVKDTGIGLSEEQQARLFQRFTQADSSTTRKYGGTGLGLSISKLLTELMGGKIGVKSKLDHGTCFTFELPLAKAKMNQTLSVGEQLIGKSVLLVEDHPITMKVTAEMFELMGMRVTCAHNVQEGYRFSKESMFDYALVDWQLPQQDGLLLLTKWHDSAGNKPNQVFIFTAFDSETLRDRLTDLPPIPVLSKPVLFHELYDKLTQTRTHNAEKEEKVIPLAVTPELSTTQNESEGHAHAFSVLLVEDNDINRMVATEMLGELPINIEIADNGKIAIEKLKERSFSLVLMDIQMPVMDGIETTKLLRETHSQDSLPIVALTANVLKEEVEYYHKIGMNAHLGKPFVREELHEIVNKFCAL